MMNDDEIDGVVDRLPCPRCGHATNYQTGFFHTNGMFNPGVDNWFRFWCPERSKFSPENSGCGFLMEMSEPHYSAKDLLERWNTRPFADSWFTNLSEFGEKVEDLKYPETWSPQDNDTRVSLINGNT